MEAFEVSHLGRIAGLDECFKSRLNKRGATAAENCLLTEEVGLGFFLEAGFQDAAACSADALGPSESDLFCIFAGILIDGNEGWNAFAFGVLAANDVAWAFRGDHDDVHFGWRNDRFVMNAEAVRENDGFSLFEIGGDILRIRGGLLGVRNGHHDDVATANGFIRIEHLESLLLSDGAAFRFGIETDDDVDAAFLEVQGVGVALRSESQNGYGFPLENFQVGVFIGIDFGGHGFWCVVCVVLVDFYSTRARATLPVRVTSSMPKVSMRLRNLLIFVSVPVISIASLLG